MAAHTEDAALETLFFPFMDGVLAWRDDGVLFLRARYGWPLQQRAWPGLVCEQSYKPDAASLQHAGLTLVTEEDDRRYALVLLLPPRQREEARALLAHALTRVQPGGRIVVCATNNEGARTIESDLTKLVGEVQTLSKNKCRVFWTAPLQESWNRALQTEWSTLDAPRTIADGRFISRPGVFAWDRIDMASALLAKHLPTDLQGRAADLGAGYGYLSYELLTRCVRINALDVYEAERRALELAERNLQSFADRVMLRYLWHDVTAQLPHRYDVIVTNPPFHTQSRLDRPDIGQRFIAAAAEALNRGGRLWLVANRHLPYETILNERFGEVKTVAMEQGFKVIEGVKA